MNNRLNAGVPNIDLVESRPRAFQLVIGKTGAVKCLYGRVLQLPHLLWVGEFRRDLFKLLVFRLCPLLTLSMLVTAPRLFFGGALLLTC